MTNLSSTQINLGEKHRMIVSGITLFTFALFGLGKELAWFNLLNFSWLDGAIITLVIAGSMSYILQKKWIYSFFVFGGGSLYLAHRHEWLYLDLKLTLFIVLLIIGGSMFIKGVTHSE
jgi:hypothetical protein